MVMRRTIFDIEGHVHFVTFSCYRRRRVLDAERCRQVVMGVLDQELRKQQGRCLGFVVMPDHVHALLWFGEDNRLSGFMKVWKGRTSHTLKKHIGAWVPGYGERMDPATPIWQKRYYDFNVNCERTLSQKLAYMHANPVRAGLVEDPLAWKHSSLGAYVDGRSVGVTITVAGALA